MNKEEVLLTEHQELVELYKHHWTYCGYFGVSYVLINAAGGSILAVIFTGQRDI